MVDKLFRHLLYCNLIGQNVTTMVQVIYTPPMLQSDWPECYNHGTIAVKHMLAVVFLSKFNYTMVVDLLVGQ